MTTRAALPEPAGAPGRRSCPVHSHLPKTNTSWWRLKFRGIAHRDPDAQLAARAGLPSGSGSTRIRSKRPRR